MATQSTFLVTSGSSSNFLFLAHDANPGKKRLVPSHVRTYLWKRHFREAQDEIISSKNTSEPQHKLTSTAPPPAPAGQVIVLKWDKSMENDSAKATQRQLAVTKDKSRYHRTAGRPLKSRSGAGKQNNNVTKIQGENNEVTADPELVQSMRSFASRPEFPALDQNQIRSLMPDDEIEHGGMMLVNALNDYYGVTGRSRRSPNPWRDVWLNFAFSDPLLFHAALAKFSMYAASINGKKSTQPQILQHKMMALRRMSQIVSNLEHLPTTETIAAALLLFNMEVFDPDLTGARAHFRATRRMIGLKGGLDKIHTWDLMKGAYVMYEYMIAFIDNELLDIPTTVSLNVPHPHAINLPAPCGIFKLSRDTVDPRKHGFSQDLVDLLALVSDYLGISDSFVLEDEHGDPRSPSIDSIIRRADQKRQDLKSRAISKGQSSAPKTEDYPLEAILLVIALQLPYLIEDTYYTNLGHEEKLEKLAHAIQNSRVHPFWEPIPGALVWAHAAGTTTSLGYPQRDYFTSNLFKTAGCVVFKCCQSVRIALATFYRVANKQKERERWSAVG